MVIASATVVNLFVSCGLWISTKDSVDVARTTLETANRPYVGLQGVGVVPDPDKGGGVSIVVNIKNFGTVPAYYFNATWEVSLSGDVLPPQTVPYNPSTLQPGDSVTLAGHIDGPTFAKVLNGERTLIIISRSSYKGPTNKDYQYCEKSQYHRNFSRFMNLGFCDGNNERPDRKS